MKSLVWNGRDDLAIEDRPRPRIAPDEVLLQVAACGICGSDLKEWKSGPVVIPQGSGPVALGHEFVGRVVEVGERVTGFSQGDRVAVEGEIRCGRCPGCLAGQYNRCVLGEYIGFHRDGGLAEYAAVPAVNLVAVPDGLDDELAALVEPFSVAVHAVRRAPGIAGREVLVTGAGTVGLAAIAAAVRSHARVTVVEPLPSRAQSALTLGAAVAVPDFAAIPERSFDVAIECSGHDAGVTGALAGLRQGGTLVTVGLHAAPTTLDLNEITLNEIEVLGSLGYANDFPAAFELLGELGDRARALISARVPIASSIEDGFGALIREDGEAGVGKILILPGASEAG